MKEIIFLREMEFLLNFSYKLGFLKFPFVRNFVNFLQNYVFNIIFNLFRNLFLRLGCKI